MRAMFNQYQNVINMANQMMQNPQQAVANAFPDMPKEISGDPNQIMGWLRQNGRINPNAMNMSRQLMRMMGR